MIHPHNKSDKLQPKIKAWRVSQKPERDDSPDPYQKRTFYIGQPDFTLYDTVRGGFRRKNLTGNA